MAGLKWNDLTDEPVGALSWDSLSDTPTNDQGDVARGFTRAFAQVPELAYGTGALAAMSAEKLFGEGGLSTAAKNYFGSKYAEKHTANQQYAPTVEFTDAWDAIGTNPGKMADWIQDSAGYVVGQGLQTIATGGIGALAGKMTLGRLVAGSAAKAADKMVAAEIAKRGLAGEAAEAAAAAMLPTATAAAARNLSTALGSGIVLTGQNLGMEAGDIYGGLLEESKKTGKEITGSDLVRAWGAAGLAAGTETVTDLLGLGALTGRIKIGNKAIQEMTGIGGRAARAGVGAGIGSILEGGQEWVQTGLEQWGAGSPLDTPEAAKERINAAAVGALGGTIMGGGAGALAPHATVADIGAAPNADTAIATAEAALAAPVDALAPAIADWQSSFDANRVPADSAVAPIGVDLQGPPAPTPAITLPTDTVPATGPIADVPLSLTSEQIVATADRLAGMPVGAQTQELLALDRPTRQAVVRAMQPSGIVTPTVLDAGQGQAAILTNEATTAASSVQPVGDASATNVPAYTLRAAQEIVGKDSTQEMRAHRDAPNRYEVVKKLPTEQPTNARAMPPTLPVSPTQQQLSEQETPAAPATRPVVPAKPLTPAQLELNRMAADAERSSLPRKSIFRNSQLRDADAPDIKGEKVTHNMRRFLTQIGKLTGTKVIFEYAPEDSEGAVPIRGENVIHINTAAQINPLQVMGHEVTHVLKDRHREAWTTIRDALVATMPDKRAALDAFAEDYWHTHPDRLEAARAMPDWSQKLTPEQMRAFNSGENTIEAFLLDELTSDLGGSHWSSEQFWTDVFAKIEAKHGSEKAKGIIQRLVASIKEALNKFLMVVRAQKQGDYTTVTPEQLEKTRDAVTSAYAKFINEERTATPEHSPRTLDRRISTSDVTSRSQGTEPQPAVTPAAAPAPDTNDIDDLEAAREDELSQLSPQRKDQRLFFEVAPNPKDTAAVAAWQQLTDSEKQAVSNDVVERIIPGLLRDIGVTGKVVTQLGGWKAHTNPSFALVVTKGDASLAARAIGYALDQEAVYAMGLKPFAGGTKTGIIEFKLDGKKAHDIYKQVRELARAVITGHSTVGNDMLIGLPIAQMNRLESAIDAIARKNDVAVNFVTGYGAIVKENQYGIQQGLQNISGQRSAEGRIADWRTKARAAFGGQSDEGSGGSDRAVSRSEVRPTYGKAIDQHAVSVTGVHYSNAKRTELNSEFYGTGYRGAERARIASATDPRIKRRVYFYTNNGSGINPESGVGYHAHSVDLNNLYNADSDPLGLWESNDSQNAGANKFESNVIDAGYDGYYTRNFGQNGAAVLLGAHAVPVKYEGIGVKPDVPARMSESRPPSWYYSPLARAAESATMKTAPASGWKDWLKSLPAKGVKPDEIKWSGIEEWLDVQGKMPVTKQQVQSFLSDFGIKVETILRGERNPKSSAVVSQDIDADEEPAELDIRFGEWEIDEPDESWLAETAGERLSDEIDERVEQEKGDIENKLSDHVDENLTPENYIDDIKSDAGTLFPLTDDELAAEAARRAAMDYATKHWQSFADDPDTTLDDDEDAIATAMERAFAVASGDMAALEEEAERRARAEIDEDKLLDELIDQERTYYYDDYDSPQTRTIRVEGVDRDFYHRTSYGEQELTYHGDDISLPRNADDADIEGAIRTYLAENDLLPEGVGPSDGTGFVPVKWEGYTTDKGRAVPNSYREVQLTLPPGTHGEVKSRPDPMGASRGESGVITERTDANDFIYTVHWNEKNVVGFARFDVHIDKDGKRVMVLQEIQGDWGQQRREGLAAQEKAESLLAVLDERRTEKAAARDALAAMLSDTAGWSDHDWRQVERLGSQGLDHVSTDSDALVAADKLMNLTTEVRGLQREYDALNPDLPDAAPFIEKTPQWAGLVLKRMIAHAIEYGFDKVVWTTGAQQVERWRSSLRKEVDTIAWEKTPEGIHIVASQRGSERANTNYAESALSDAIGKIMAQRIVADPNQSGEITGDDITISDTGMAGFYDKMLPNIANEILKKLDKTVRVKEIEVHPVRTYSMRPDPDSPSHWQIMQDGHELVSHPTKERAEENIAQLEASYASREVGTQQGFEITDKLKESAANGLPLMSERRRAAADRKANDRRAWYYSQLSVAVNDIPRKIKTGKEAALWLQSNAAKLGVKKDELVWSGVLDWLAAQPTPAGVQDWLANNGVRVREVVLGEETPEYRRLDEEWSVIDQQVDRLREAVLPSMIESSRMISKDKNRIHDLTQLGFTQQEIDAAVEYGAALNRKNELFEQRKAARGEPVKYDTKDLTLPGGSRYRELLLTLPHTDMGTLAPKRRAVQKQMDELRNGRLPENMSADENAKLDAMLVEYDKLKFKPPFTGSHFPQPNIIAHLRFNERTDADGKRVLFIEEVQGDWGQKGRKEGFKQAGWPDGFSAVKKKTLTGLAGMAGLEEPKISDAFYVRRPDPVWGDADGYTVDGTGYSTEERAREVAWALASGGRERVPAAPFVTDTQAWVALALKRAIAYAVDNGFDRVAWTTGEQQVERYDLSKTLRKVVVMTSDSGKTFKIMGTDRSDNSHDFGTHPANKLEGVVGKDLAAKIAQQKTPNEVYAGNDLKVGGEGMRGFYDQIVPQVARSLGATIGTVRLQTGGAAQVLLGETTAQPGFDITDKMREQAAIGMPLFSEPRKPLDQWLGKSVVRGVMYHGTARDITTFRPQQADAIFLTDNPEFAANFADLSHDWMMNNYWTWMTPDQIQQAKRDAMRLLLQDALPGSSFYMREERMLNQSRVLSKYMQQAVEKYMPSESNIMPLYVRAENPFDYRNPEHVAAIEAEIGTSWLGQEAINGEMHEVSQHIGDLERGDWNAIESPQVQAYIRQHHDSFYVRERGVTNLAVFSPNQVKSASGNDGSYSREDNDIRRSEARVPNDEMKRINMAQRFGEGLSVVPEDMFHREHNPGIEYSGVYQTAAEHIGDLIHRLSYREEQGGGVQYGIEAAINKASRFVKASALDDALPQLYRNYEYHRDERGYKGSKEDFERDFRKAATRYAEAYKDMPYATLPQFLAKRAAVNLGELNFPAVRANLRQLIEILESDTAEENYWAPFVAGETARRSEMRQAIIDGAAEIVKMSDAVRDDLDPANAPGGWHAYEYYEAQKLLPKPSEKLKKLTDRNTFILGQDNEYLANVDGTYFGVNKWEDPDDTDDDIKFVYAFNRLDDPFGKPVQTTTDQQDELFTEMRKYAGDTARQSTPRSRMTGQPINQSWTDPNVTDWDDLVRKMQDDKIDTKRVLRAIRDAGVAVKEKFDAYLLETNYHGRAAARVDAFADGELRKLMEDMAMRKLSMADLDDYLWARHAPERNAANNRSNPAITDGSGMSDAQSAAILAGQAVTVGTRTIQLTPAALRAATAVSSRVDAITKGTLDLLVSYGLETQQTVDTWKRTYAHYAPLKRDMESDSNYSGAFNLGNGSGAGFDVRGAASKRALGSKRAVTDVLANIAMQRERAITRGEKNRVSQAVYGLALSAPNPEFWIPVNTDLNQRLTPAALAKVVAELVGIGVNPLDAQNLATEPVQRYIDPKTGLESQRINPALRGRETVLSTRINGEDRYVFFSNKKRAQEMVRGLKNLDAADVSGALQVIAPVTRWFAAVNTQYNPIFGMTNGVRDFSTGMLNLSSTPLSADRAAVAKYAFSALRGIYADLRDHRAGRTPTSQWAQLFEQFELDGGRTGYRDMFSTSTDRAEAIAKELEHAGKGKQWVLGGEKHSAVFGWLSDYNTAVENAMRLAAYKAALDKGMSRDAAASLAKNLTVNFNKRGLAATQTGALYAFFNAAVQGTARIAETTSKDGKLTAVGQKIVYGGMLVGVMQAIMGALAGWDDDEPRQFAREKNLLIPLPGTDKYLSIPMPLGFHVLPNVGRITAEWMMSGFKDPGKRLVRLANIVLDAFNPIGSGTLAQTLSPTIGDPIIALAENEDWTGKSIYKADFDKLHPTAGWTRTKDTASPPSRWLSYAINYVTGGGKYEIGMASPTPDQIDYLVGQATGGTGRELLKTAQYVSSKATGEELPLHKMPLGVGRFVGETKGQSSEMSRFYRNLERIGEHKSALREMKDAGDGAAMQAYLAENPDARMVQTADKAQREIAYLRRQKREVLEKGGNPERVKMLDERITAMAARYNQVLRGR